MKTTTYGWNIDTKGNRFPSEFANYEAYWQKLTNDYVAELNNAIANGTYESGWLHANCDHANNFCNRKGN